MIESKKIAHGRFNMEDAYASFIAFRNGEISLDEALVPALPMVRAMVNRKYRWVRDDQRLEDIYAAGFLEVIFHYQYAKEKIPENAGLFKGILRIWSLQGCAKGMRQTEPHIFEDMPQWWSEVIAAEQESRVISSERVKIACENVLKKSRFPEYDQLLVTFLNHLKTKKRPQVGPISVLFGVDHRILGFLWQYTGMLLRRELTQSGTED